MFEASHGPQPVALVGIAAALPSGPHMSRDMDYRAFCEFLLHKKEAYETIPCDRFNTKGLKGNALGQIVTDKGCFLKDISLFDHVEFGVSSKDARAMAVSSRKLLELAFLALLDSGIVYRSQNVGCYMSGVDFDMLSIAEPDEFEPRGSFGGIPCMIANRVSYHLDLLGPSISLDTACSSTLTAMHLAVQALRNGDCSAALVGGCQLNHRFIDWVTYSQGSVLAPDGKSKPFDASANGFSRGEGAVVVVIKLLEDAIRDGDHVYATILGTGINQCGSAAPIGAPVAEAQEIAMERAYAQSRRSPRDVDFIELHATGTAAGDPTEANWVGRKFKRDDELLVGSVKGNIGHLEITAFLASLLKVCSIFETGIIPPNVNFTTANPAIKWEELKLRVPVEPTPIPKRRPCKKILVSIASSGIGGSNGHAVIEEPTIPSPESGSSWKDGPVLLLGAGLSPRSAAAVNDALVQIALQSNAMQLPNLSAIMGRRARQLIWRSSAVYCPGVDEKPKFSTAAAVPRTRSPIVFVFSGQGPQHIAMGRQLYASKAVFRDSVDEMDKYYQKLTGASLLSTYGLFGGPSTIELPLIWPISVTLPAIAIVQVALVDLLHSVGVTPDIVMGHSAGETAMLYVSCGATREMVVQLAIARGRAFSEVENRGGTMAAVSCSVKGAKSIISSATEGDSVGKVEIGCFNALEGVTLSGLETYVEKAVLIATERNVFATKLRTRVPVHSSLMDSCRTTYTSLVEEAFTANPCDYTPKKVTYSTFTGERWAGPFTPEYFWHATRSPVRFSQAMAALLHETPNATFIEISPHPVLSSYITSHIGHTSTNVVTCPMRRKRNGGTQDELRYLLGALGDLIVAGCNTVDLAALYDLRNIESKDLQLPEYPFVRKHVPYRPEMSIVVSRQLKGRRGPLSGPGLRVNALTHPILAQHVIKGEPIMPAAGYIEMAIQCGAKQLWDVRFNSILSLSSPTPVTVNINLEGSHWNISSDGGDNLPRIHSSGYLSCDEPKVDLERVDIQSIKDRCVSVSLSGFYESFETFASYGPAFQRVEALYMGNDEFLTQIRGRASDLTDLEGYIMHPAVLDSCIHVSVHKLSTNSSEDDVYYLPSRVETVFIHPLLEHWQGLPETLFVHAQFRRWRPDDLTYDFNITNLDGLHLVTLRGLEVSKHSSRVERGILFRFDVAERPVDTLPTPQLLHSTPPTAQNPYHTIHFARGREMDVQRTLRTLDQNIPNSVWFCASTGVDGASARGLSRSLRKEIPVWDVRLVIFPENWIKETRESTISYFASSGNPEEEMTVMESGTVTSPRFEISEAPQSRVLQHNIKWEVIGNRTLSYSHPLPPSDGRFLVEIEHISASEGGLRGFYGEISAGAHAGTKVLGITDEPLSNYALVPEGWTINLHASNQEKDVLPALALGALAACFALGLSTICQPCRASHIQVLVVASDNTVTPSLLSALSMLGIQHRIIESLSLEHRAMISSSDLVISGFTDKTNIQLMEGAMSSHSSLVLWSDPVTGILATVKKQVWLPRDAMTVLIRCLANHCVDNVKLPRSLPPTDVLNALQLSSMAVSQSLFDASKVYLLIGGLGSLGVHIALWMYQRGARKLVLTSRNGKKSASLKRLTKVQRILSYLETVHDLDLRVQCCDATSLPETRALLDSISDPIAGCMLLAVTLSDRSFLFQSEETFARPFGKVAAFQVLEKAIDIDNLDFMIAFSSVTSFGNAGQTNYTAANTLLEELTRPYAKAFSMVLPLILDSSVNVDEGRSVRKFTQLSSWAINTEELYKYIEDGIFKLNDGPFWLYIPDFDWSTVHKHMGSSYLYDHLVDRQSQVESEVVTGEKPAESVERIIRDRLGVSKEDFSSKVPLTSYGLDSLSAAQISFSLKPFMTISQIQLLANVCTDDLLARLEEDAGKLLLDSTTKDFDWTNLNASGQTVVKLVDVEGNPMILVHGISGTIVSFKPLQDRLTRPLWVIQTTPETPLNSIDATSQFYFQEIKKLKPAGPYILGGYCATSIIAYRLAMLFESNGDVVEELIFIDHFPLLYCTWNFDKESVESGIASRELVREGFLLLADVYARDGSPGREKMGKEYLDLFDGVVTKSEASDFVASTSDAVEVFIYSTLNFLLGLTGGDLSSMRERLIRWIRGVKAPLTVYVATEGMLACLPAEVRKDWEDLGARACNSDARVITIRDTAHFTIVESEDFLDDIQGQNRG